MRLTWEAGWQFFNTDVQLPTPEILTGLGRGAGVS